MGELIFFCLNCAFHPQTHGPKEFALSVADARLQRRKLVPWFFVKEEILKKSPAGMWAIAQNSAQEKWENKKSHAVAWYSSVTPAGCCATRRANSRY